jgi:hypothetical protein
LDAGRFVKVFDVAASGFKDWQFPAFGLIFVAIGTVAFFAPRFIKQVGIPFFDFPSKRLTFFRYGFLGFAVFWTAATFLTTYIPYSRHRDLLERKACSVVEGPIRDFVPMPYEGHADESFSVSGVEFRYSDYAASDAFNNTSSHGGPINKDAYVRICYDPSNHAILRLEIRDFQGTPKNYAEGDSLFGDFGKASRNASPLTSRETEWLWLANIWVSLYFLDLLLSVRMFLPYLRTFWRIKTISIAGTGVPTWLERERKIKLRNSLAYWDATKGAIWLRPRGFNFWRVPLTVATLNIDEHLQTTNWEIRFSSGMPLILSLFLFSAFQMFSIAMPGGKQAAAIFVGLVSVMVLLNAVFYRRRVIPRMQMLVQDALEEFAGETT